MRKERGSKIPPVALTAAAVGLALAIAGSKGEAENSTSLPTITAENTNNVIVIGNEDPEGLFPESWPARIVWQGGTRCGPGGKIEDFEQERVAPGVNEMGYLPEELAERPNLAWCPGDEAWKARITPDGECEEEVRFFNRDFGYGPEDATWDGPENVPCTGRLGELRDELRSSESH